MSNYYTSNIKDILKISNRYEGELNALLAFLWSLRDNLKVESWIAGGAIRRFLSMDNPTESDVDIFFNNREDVFRVKQFILGKGTSNLVREHDLGCLIHNNNSILKDVNLVYREYASIEDCLDSFDYTICQVALTSSGLLVSRPDILLDIARKRLRLNKVTYPVSTLRRLYKYQKQGYTACSGCYVELIKQIRSIPEDQLNTDMNVISFLTRRIL